MGEIPDEIGDIENYIEEKPLYYLFFLRNDEDLGVEVKEASDVDYIQVKKRLENGESVFISRKNPQDLDAIQDTREDPEESWYFTHL